ncbi:SagB family peptide dehydrogenase [Rathayibacter soli]|uniref:SagB family peptide dehydrogenase n=1 Tax=Rathayibacter soli TaxID=3144168 RepID=UPI0027E4CCCE|nr:SagB family peptide dehydrogenase [Glaciibacter superstes]
MSALLLIAVRTEVIRTTAQRADGRESEMLAARWGALPLPHVGTPERAPVDRLLAGPASPDELDELAAAGGPSGLARWMLWATYARDRSLICYRLQTADGALLADLIPTSPEAPNFMLAPPASPPAGRVQLSRFAVLHRGGSRMILESPRATMRAELSTCSAATLAAFTVPVSVSVSGEVDLVLSALLQAGLLAGVGDDGLLDEDRDATLSQWEFQDLLLHARTRTNRPDEPRGGTYPFAELRSAPPAVAHPLPANVDPDEPALITLERPDLSVLMSTDPPFARVMEERASRRDLGPLTLGSLSEFLYRTMRVRGQRGTTDDPHAYPTTSRPHPSAGGMYEFTAYLAIDNCHGLDAGLYRYDPVEHGLSRVASRTPDVDRLLAEGGWAAALTAPPPVLVILAADFRRLSWKYEGIAYALTLKNAGVLFATMQLAATAMGLGSCPVGAGDSDLFARAADTRSFEESSVGELLLGS